MTARILDGNIFIKAIVTGEKKFVGVIIKYTGLTVIGTEGIFLLTQFTPFAQDKLPVEVIEKKEAQMIEKASLVL